MLASIHTDSPSEVMIVTEPMSTCRTGRRNGDKRSVAMGCPKFGPFDSTTATDFAIDRADPKYAPIAPLQVRSWPLFDDRDVQGPLISRVWRRCGIHDSCTRAIRCCRRRRSR